ncbi:hypothetical protein E0T50_000447 [Enterococcus faecalis]|nr:hypothetical protein [Enterococcus faecalis]
MLSQSRIKDLNVLYQICITNTTTYTELNKITQIPIRTLKKIIDRLNTSIDDLFFLKDYINVSTKGEISIKPTEKINSFEILFRLRLHWYKTNQSFQLISLVLSERNLSKSKIIEKLFISETTLQRLLFKLNIYLKPFDFALAYKDGFLNFSGNEINIRLFLFQLNFFTYFNLEWPSSLSTIDSLEEDLVIFLEDFPTTQTDVKLRGALIWVALLKQRFQQNNFLIPNTNPEIKTILHEFKELNKLQSFNNLFFETIPPQEKITEELLLEFLVRIYVPDIDSCKEKEQLGRKFTNLNNTLTNSATRIIKALDKSLLIDAFDQSIYLRIFHLVFFMLINKVIGKSMMPLLYMHFPIPKYHLNTNNSLMDKIKASVTETENHSEISVNLISSYLYSLYLPHRPKSISIYLSFSKDPSAPYFVRNRIYEVYNPQYIDFTNTAKDADLIISDQIDPSLDFNHFFYLSHTNNDTSWKTLLANIQELLSDKLLK